MPCVKRIEEPEGVNPTARTAVFRSGISHTPEFILGNFVRTACSLCPTETAPRAPHFLLRYEFFDKYIEFAERFPNKNSYVRYPRPRLSVIKNNN